MKSYICFWVILVIVNTNIFAESNVTQKKLNEIYRYDLYSTQDLAIYISNLMNKRINLPFNIDDSTVLYKINSSDNYIKIFKKINLNYIVSNNVNFSSKTVRDKMYSVDKNYICSDDIILYTLYRGIEYNFEYKDSNYNKLIEYKITKKDCDVKRFNIFKKTTNKSKLKLETQIYPFIQKLNVRENDIFMHNLLNINLKDNFSQEEFELLKRNVYEMIIISANLIKSDDTLNDYMKLASYIDSNEKKKFIEQNYIIFKKLNITSESEYEKYKILYKDKIVDTIKIFIEILKDMESSTKSKISKK